MPIQEGSKNRKRFVVYLKRVIIEQDHRQWLANHLRIRVCELLNDSLCQHFVSFAKEKAISDVKVSGLKII